MNFRSQNNGFTLLEVLIAMVILSFISLAIYQATVETFKLREVLSNEGDFHNGIRLALDVVQRDVSQIFSPLPMLPPKSTTAKPPDARDMDTIMGEFGQTTQYWGGALDKTGIRSSHFIGADTKMSFISTSHIRIYKDAPESELAKISFELKTDEGNRDVPGALLLIKTESPNVFEEDDRRDKSAVSFPLLHGIKKFRIQYYRRDKQQWSSSWDSESSDTKDLFPDRIKIELEVAGPTQLNFEGIYLFRPEIPFYGIDPST